MAFADDSIKIPIALDTVKHANFSELHTILLDVISQREVSEVVIGLPKLPSGDEGQQSKIVRDFVIDFPFPSGTNHHFIDERYTTPRFGKNDPDAAAACALLGVYLDKLENS